MAICVKSTENGSIITVYNPKQRLHFFRPLRLDELELLCDYGEEIAINILEKRLDSKYFNRGKL